MAGRQIAARIATVWCLLLVVGVGLPFVALDTSSVELYYSAGPVDPLLAGLLGICCAIVIAAASTERTEPSLAAGVSLSLMLFSLGITASWALSLDTELILSFPVDPLFQYHPLAVVLTALLGTVSVFWYSHSLQLV